MLSNNLWSRDLKPKQIRKLQDIRETARSFERPCIVEGCKARAIRSHLLQKNGGLQAIAEGKHVVELREDNLFAKERFYFRRFGVNDAMTFLGFCSAHDTEIFREIEVDGADLASPRAALLLTYRALAAEIRKRENGQRWFDRVLANDGFCKGLPSYLTDHFRRKMPTDRLALEIWTSELRRLERFVMTGSMTDLASEAVDMPDTGLCVSSVVLTKIEMPSRVLQQSVYLHLVPTAGKTKAILVWRNTHPPMLQLGSQPVISIADILIRWTETWAIRPSVYEKHYRPREAQIAQEFGRILANKSLPLTMNILDYVQAPQNVAFRR